MRAISVSSGRMSRPKLDVKMTTLRLFEGQAARIEKLDGPHRMAKFVREAVEAELQRREKSSLSPSQKRKPVPPSATKTADPQDLAE